MPAPCPQETPPWFRPFYHTIAAISAPINILGLYLVLYKFQGISKYKYCIFYVQAAAFLTEIQMSVVSPARFFFPLLAGFHTNELVAKITTNNHMLMTIWLFYLGNELPAIVWCFVFRHNAAEDMSGGQRMSRIVKKIALSTCQTFPLLVSGCFYMSHITREEATEYLTNNYPQCLFWLDTTVFSIYDWRTNPWIAVTGIGAVVCVLVYFLYGFSLGVRTMLLLHKLRSHMSPATYRMHKTALIGLTLQVIIPSVLLMLPVGICFWIVAFDLVEHQELATNSTVLISFHSVTSTIVMIAANPRYRGIVGGYFCKMCRYYNQKTVTVEPSSTNQRRSVIIHHGNEP